MTVLAELSSARKALAEADTLAKTIKCIDGAEAMRVLARKIGLGKDAQNDWAEYKLDAQRQAGQMLADMGERRGRQNSHRESFNADLGINHNQSSRWQQQAGVPADLYTAWVASQRACGEVTDAGLMKLANKLAGDRRRKDHADQIVDDPAAPLIEHATWDTWLPQQPCCDLLLTDPPYMTDIAGDIADFAADWLPAALSKVKPTGRAYICIGGYPDEIAAYLAAPRAGMDLAQILVWTYRNATNRQPKRHYIQNWQAILYFLGEDAPALDAPDTTEQFAAQDINAPDARRDDRFHTWQKPDVLAERIIRHSTDIEGLVLDPFAGTGTFVLAAARLGRVGLGCDIDERMLTIAKDRGARII